MDTGSLSVARFRHTATLLQNGMVLAAGGRGIDLSLLGSAELYDPATGTWMDTGSLVTPRAQFTATLLPDAKVLIAGGEGGGEPTASAELYDPASGTWTETGRLVTGRAAHTATLLPDSRVLIAAGYASPVYSRASSPAFDHRPLASAELGTATATPTPTPTPGPITLSAAGHKVGGINTVHLTWSGATSANIDVYRDRVVIATVPNTGSDTDSTGDTGRARYTYKVCEAGTMTCSNDATVRFRQ
ncbi:MAG: hypothetical protein DMF00_11130 [Verrucomicrobia bacterium]|nr:MAG: hypothetical protein DMF00_11130 [Verrucomicrobiota bacterium]